TQIDDGVALLAIDFQHATTAFPSAVDMAGVVANARRLADGFRDRGKTVVLTRADLNALPPGRADYASPGHEVPLAALDLVPELGQVDSDLVLDKTGWGAFAHTSLEELLAERGITQLVLCGLATNFGVESTAREAYDLGYHVTIATDAVNSPVPPGHDYALTSVFPVLAQTGTTDEILAALA
ncbi:MAG: isochorismatase family cysteine hydrolase, partial [Nocardioidaceae bacterium]